MASNSRRSRFVVIAMVILAIVGSILLTKAIHVSTAEHLRHLDSTDPDTVAYSLVILTDRRDPAGIEKAESLVKSDNPRIWMDAAIYLGAMGKPEAVPYLIKALPQADLDQGIEIVQELTQLTGKPFGNDVKGWEDWWGSQGPGAATRE